MMTIYNILNNLSETSFVAGSEQTFTFTAYNDDGVTLLDIDFGSASWNLCQYGEFQTIILTKTGTIINSHQFTILLNPTDTESLSGKFIQQITVTDNSGETFTSGQGTIIILPSIPES